MSRTSDWSPISCPEEIGREEAFSEEQIIGFLRKAEAVVAIKDLCWRHGFSEASYYLWRSKFGGVSVPGAKRLKKLLAERLFENDLIKEAPQKSSRRTGASGPVRQWMQRGASGRLALAITGMSASAPRPVRGLQRGNCAITSWPWRTCANAMAWE